MCNSIKQNNEIQVARKVVEITSNVEETYAGEFSHLKRFISEHKSTDSGQDASNIELALSERILFMQKCNEAAAQVVQQLGADHALGKKASDAAKKGLLKNPFPRKSVQLSSPRVRKTNPIRRGGKAFRTNAKQAR